MSSSSSTLTTTGRLGFVEDDDDEEHHDCDDDCDASCAEPGMRVVRFDRECVVIPLCKGAKGRKAKGSVVVTRSYSLPLWKRRTVQGKDGQRGGEGSGGGVCESEVGDEECAMQGRVVIRVPIPTFRRRSRSPTRGRSSSTSPHTSHSHSHLTLTPCLVHRDPSTSPELSSSTSSNHHHHLKSSPRPALAIYHRRREDVTVPLRECCRACERITEESLRVGESWEEKFSRGARRRRRSGSLEGAGAGAGVGGGGVGECKVELTVDEVDKRRKSLDLGLAPGEGVVVALERQGSEGSVTDGGEEERAGAVVVGIPDILDARRCLRASPIEEEDEAELFPLPRRTPSASPSPKVSPAASPNGSSSCLAVGVRKLPEVPCEVRVRVRPLPPLPRADNNNNGGGEPFPVMVVTPAVVEDVRTAPGSPGSVGKGRRKTSFTMPFVRAGEAIKGVSAEVLKGVSSMSVGSPF